MAKPIIVTDDFLQEIAKEFIEELKKSRMSTGKVSYTRTLNYKSVEKATIRFTPLAYMKMTALVFSYSSEVAWHGVCHRDEEQENMFHITDILVYPQSVTGTTVDMDQEGYAKWICENIEDERFFNIRMQGHSHVNMTVSPSGTDDQHKEQILKEVKEDEFYIFMIWNKKLDNHIEIFDVKNNVKYEDNDVLLDISDDAFDMKGFVEDARKMTPTKSWSTTNTKPASTTQNAAPAIKPSNSGIKPVGGTKSTDKKKVSAYDDDYYYDRDFYDYFGYGGYYGSR